MTKEEINKILHTLGLDEWRESESLYVFYRTPDGMVHNFALGVRRGRTMSDDEVVDLMRREYPSTRESTVMGVDRPRSGEYHEEPQPEWIDVPEACRMLKITAPTLRKWTAKGAFTAHRVDRKIYYDRREIDRALADNYIKENGRLDTTWHLAAQ